MYVGDIISGGQARGTMGSSTQLKSAQSVTRINIAGIRPWMSTIANTMAARATPPCVSEHGRPLQQRSTRQSEGGTGRRQQGFRSPVRVRSRAVSARMLHLVGVTPHRSVPAKTGSTCESLRGDVPPDRFARDEMKASISCRDEEAMAAGLL